MYQRKADILAFLVEVYKEFYTYKDLFKMNFKYSPSDIENFYKQFHDSMTSGNNKQSNAQETIRADILSMKTVDDIKGYLIKYRSNGVLSKDALIKELSLDEFDYLYKIIYKSSLKSNMRKIDALNSIDKYFNGVSRAISMKP
jgi:hypothetical protein